MADAGWVFVPCIGTPSPFSGAYLDTDGLISLHLMQAVPQMMGRGLR